MTGTNASDTGASSNWFDALTTDLSASKYEVSGNTFTINAGTTITISSEFTLQAGKTIINKGTIKFTNT